MANVFNYLKWRGDLSFSEAPLNEIDSLIFALISYVDFNGIVGDENNPETITMNTAANAFFARHTDVEKISLGLILPKDILRLLREIKDLRRFRRVGLRAYVNQIDLQKQTQFSAITFRLPTGQEIAAFRGTDDTLIGWKEDFNMSFQETIPAQISAKEYLDTIAKASVCPLFACGHSKGGNLAVYAVMNAEKQVRDRIADAWNFDGPGFAHNILQDPKYLAVRPMIHTIVPQSSVVGMLLEHDDVYTTVKSKQIGILQHNAFSWQLMGGKFVTVQKEIEKSRTNKVLNQWVREMTPAQREQFTEAIYSILSTGNTETLTELATVQKGRLAKLRELDPIVYKTVVKTLSELIGLNTKSFFGDLFSKKKKK